MMVESRAQQRPIFPGCRGHQPESNFVRQCRVRCTRLLMRERIKPAYANVKGPCSRSEHSRIDRSLVAGVFG